MGARLDQVLGYLDRDGVSEIVISVGRPLTLRRNGQLVPVTSAPLTKGQLTTLVGDTPLWALVPADEGTSEAVDVDVGARRLRVQAGRRGEEIVLRIERAAVPPAPPPSAVPRSPTPIVGLNPTPPRSPTPSAGLGTSIARSPTPSDALAARTPTRGQAVRVAFSPSPQPTPAPGPDRPLAPAAGRSSPGLALELDASDLGLELSVEGASTTPAAASASASQWGAFGADNPAAAPGGPLDMGLVLDASDGPALELAVESGPSTASVNAYAATWSAPPSSGVAETPASAIAEPPRRATRHDAPASSAPIVPGMLASLVKQAHAARASDLLIASTRVTTIRVSGELTPLDPRLPPSTRSEVEALLGPIIAAHQARFDAVGYIDLALESPVGGRLRVNIARHQGGLKGTFRLAFAAPPTLEQLALPRELSKVIHHHQGLVVIAGPSGHGKTTTLAALVDLVNAARAFHIITVEDPIEIVYPRKAAVVSQREVGPHTRSFASALKGSLREDPDVIVIGELRDRETVEIALTAAETGHLVLATMSTPSAAKTIDRLVDMFPPDDQSQVRASIAGALRAIVAQRLLPAADGSGLVAAVELLTGCLPLSAMIREDKLYQLPNLMQRGRAFGMIRLDESLLELARAGRISVDAALAVTENKKEMTAHLRPAAAPPAAAPQSKSGLLGRKGRE